MADDLISMIGPLPSSDSALLQRIRFHQAWYRAEVLGIPEYGSFAGSGAKCGSVLPDAAAALYRNFIGPLASSEYQLRRRQGWGVDPVRCTKYMTSSQTLTFNMLAEAVSRPIECAALFGILTAREDFERLIDYQFEYSAVGKRHSLGDRTLIDALLAFRTNGGDVQVVAIETKLADRFSTRRTAAMHGALYAAIQEESGLWHSLELALLDNQTRQLVRCHALAQSVQRTYGRTSQAVMLSLLHDADEIGFQATAAYEGRVAISGSTVIATWGHYLEVAERVGAVDPQTLLPLRERYVDLSRSEGYWEIWRQNPA